MNRSKLFSDAAVLFRRAILSVSVFSTAASAAPVTIVNNGPPANRVDILFLGDGYTQADLDTGLYNQHMESYLDYMFTASGFLADPFPRYKNFFNVHEIEVVSNESGADIPSQSIFRDTALDATYESFGINRALTISDSKADAIRDLELAGSGITADMQLVTVNHTKYGGFGTSWAVFAGANSAAREIALHELGHSFSDLADEYVTMEEAYSGPEPPVRNVTTDPTGQKWSHWHGFVDPRGANLNIGAYEGAAYYPFGLYRPSPDSKMRNLDRAFDAVSREAFIHDIYENVDPLDDWLDNGQTVIDSDLWVDVVDPDVIHRQWYVDDVLVPGATGEQFRPRDFGYGPGTYDVRVRAFDEILNYSFSGGVLDLVRSQFGALEQSVSWSLMIAPSLPGDYNGDDLVDSLDYELWRKTFGSSELLAADGNNDGAVDAGDYVVWRYFFSRGSGSAAATSVPEATASGIAIVALLMCSAQFRARVG